MRAPGGSAPAVDTDPSDRRLLTRLVHDLRGPLNVFRLDVQLLHQRAERISTPEEQEALARLSCAGRRMERLLEDIIAYTQVRTEGLELSREPTDVLKLVRSVVERYRPLAAAASVELELEFEPQPEARAPDPLPPLMLDPLRLATALERLLDHGLCRAQRSGAPLRVGVESSATGVRVLLYDGAGPPSEIAEPSPGATPSWRAPSPGLLLARACIEAHGGILVCARDPAGRPGYGLSLPS